MTTIRSIVPSDWPAVEEIYRHGIEDGEATFETQTPSWEAFDEGKLAEPRLVAVDKSGAVGIERRSAVKGDD